MPDTNGSFNFEYYDNFYSYKPQYLYEEREKYNAACAADEAIGMISLEEKENHKNQTACDKELALQHAEDQLMGTLPVPEDFSGCLKYPNVEVLNNFTPEQMGYMDRIQTIQAHAKGAETMNKTYADLAVEYLMGGENGNTFYRDMEEQMEKMRIVSRATKIAHTKYAAEELQEEYKDLANSPACKKFESVLEGIEATLGLNDKPITQESKDLLYSFIKVPPIDAVLPFAQVRNPNPEMLNFKYPDLDDTITCLELSNPENWIKNPDDFQKDFRSGKGAEKYMQSYLEATANKQLDAVFGKLENGVITEDGPSRASLITIEGKSVRTMIMEDMERAGIETPEARANFFDQFGAKLTSQKVSAALVAGARVEAFVPDRFGKLPDEPVVVTQTGIDTAKMQPVALNGVQKILNKMGFYKEKAANAQRYKQVMDGRQEVKDNYAKDTAPKKEVAKNEGPKNEQKKNEKNEAKRSAPGRRK